MGFNWTSSQSEIIKHKSGDLLVSAGAGSGKTAVLVEHIISRVFDKDDPVDIDRLLVLTYTRAAAAEMKDRIRKRFEGALDMADDEESAAFIRKQLTLLNTAQISTIDSFCQKVLKELFFKVDLDPGFTVLDETEGELLKNDLLKKIMDEMYEQKDPHFLDLADRYGRVRSDDDLAGLVMKMLARARLEPEPEKWLTEQFGKADISWMDEAAERSRRLLEGYLAQYESLYNKAVAEVFPDKLISGLHEDTESIKQALGSEDGDIIKAVSQIAFAKKAPRPRKDPGPEWDNPMIDIVFENRDRIKKKISGITEIYRSYDRESIIEEEKYLSVVRDELIEVTLRLYTEFQAAKKKEAKADFTDIEQMVWKLFVGTGDEPFSADAVEYAGRFDEILVDEYQDCNALQEDILTCLAAGGFKRFMVGDVKQSIYGFRGGRPDIFLSKYDGFNQKKDPGQKVIELRDNFRSSPGVLNGINLLFSKMMIKAKGGIDYANDAALRPGVSGSDTEGADIRILISEGETSGTPFEGSKGAGAEAVMVAEKIYELVSSGYMVRDKDTGNMRPVTYGDFAILLRSVNTKAQYYIEALNAYGIPCYSESEKGYYDSLEVRETLSYLSILDNPYQDTELLGVLRSGYASFTANELAVIKIHSGCTGHRWLFDDLKAFASKDDEAYPALLLKVCEFLSEYDRYRKLSESLSLCELIGRIISETGYCFYIRALPHGKKRMLNLQMLKTRARDYELTRFRGIFKFLRYIDEMKNYEMDITTPSLTEGNDSVVIMTIHKSKGLEFPVCIVAGTCTDFNMRDAAGKILFDNEMGVGLDIIDTGIGYRYPSLKKKCIALKKKDAIKTEEMRLLYVAMTRAKDLLIITGLKSGIKDKTESIYANTDAGFAYLSPEDIGDASCYMDWVIRAFVHELKSSGLPLWGEDMVASAASDGTHITAEVMNFDTLAEPRGNDTVKVETATGSIPEKLEKLLGREYSFENEKGLHSIYTVSELKAAHYINETEPAMIASAEEESRADKTEKKAEEKNKKLKGVQRGNAYHKALEMIDFTVIDPDDPIKGVKKELKRLRETDILTQDEAETVEAGEISKLFLTDIGRKMIGAALKGDLYKEQEFVHAVPASEIKELAKPDTNEKVLVQGIIDAVFFDEDGWVIVDYKTDRTDPKNAKEILLQRYSVQLRQYALAWEDITGEKVKECFIYSIPLGRMIKNDIEPL
ncbi:MAG: helicase-exonuclease AddAB subunit AddA [Lachnospiraceae bacterium]|nr:helicase-exonuclease AddAB subunit AddA [Lachnospiraceae bacterium]